VGSEGLAQSAASLTGETRLPLRHPADDDAARTLTCAKTDGDPFISLMYRQDRPARGRRKGQQSSRRLANR
jgi:hypothetical protein